MFEVIVNHGGKEFKVGFQIGGASFCCAMKEIAKIQWPYDFHDVAPITRSSLFWDALADQYKKKGREGMGQYVFSVLSEVTYHHDLEKLKKILKGAESAGWKVQVMPGNHRQRDNGGDNYNLYLVTKIIHPNNYEENDLYATFDK